MCILPLPGPKEDPSDIDEVEGDEPSEVFIHTETERFPSTMDDDSAPV